MKKSIILAGLASLVIAAALPLSANAAADAHTGIQSFRPNDLIKSDGTYWVWGGTQAVPTQVDGLTEVKAAFDSEIVMKKDGSVWHWERTAPSSATIDVEPIAQLNDVAQVYETGHWLLAVDASGRLYGTSKTENIADPDRLSLLAGIDDVASIASFYESFKGSGDERYLLLKKDGSVWTTDDNFASFRAVPSLDHISDLQYNIALKEDGTAWIVTEQYEMPKAEAKAPEAARLDGISDIRAIRANGRSNLAIDRQNRLWFWGETLTGYSDGTVLHDNKPLKPTNISDVADAAIVDERNLLVLTGNGQVRQAFIGQDTMTPSPDFSLLLSDVALMKPDYRHIIMQKNDGTLWGWGVNKNGDLGNGDYEFMHDAPVAVQKPVSVRLNGEPVVMNTGVIIRKDQAFVPLRSIFEKLGALVEWDEVNKTVTIRQADKAGNNPAMTVTVDFRTGAVAVNGKAANTPTAPFAVQGVSYLPLRLISESLGAKVDWMQQEGNIAITMA